MKSAETFFTAPDGQRYSMPGDYARVEADGQVTLLGRGSVSINSGGEKIYPEEVEQAIKSHPDAYDAVVIGVPDERFGNRVAAIVQPRPGATPTLEEIQAHCRKHIAGYKVPRQLTLVDGDRALARRQARLPLGETRRARVGLTGGLGAVDVEQRAVDVAGFGRGEVRDRAGDLVRLGEFRQRHHLLEQRQSKSSGNVTFAVSGVFTPPGAIATTRSPRFAYSTAIDFVSATTAAFVAQ